MFYLKPDPSSFRVTTIFLPIFTSCLEESTWSVTKPLICRPMISSIGPLNSSLVKNIHVGYSSCFLFLYFLKIYIIALERKKSIITKCSYQRNMDLDFLWQPSLYIVRLLMKKWINKIFEVMLDSNNLVWTGQILSISFFLFLFGTTHSKITEDDISVKKNIQYLPI